jgi:hypothetical protein
MSTSCTNRSIIVNLRLDLLVSLLGLRIIILDLALLGGCGGLLGSRLPLGLLRSLRLVGVRSFAGCLALHSDVVLAGETRVTLRTRV